MEEEVAEEQPNDEVLEETPGAMLDASDDEAIHNDEVVRHMRGELGTGLAEPDPCPDIDEDTKRSGSQAHKNLVHPARDAFLRMLRLGDTKADAITYAKHWQCPVCLQTAAPHLQRPAMTRQKQVYDFNDTVAAYLVTLHDANGQA